MDPLPRVPAFVQFETSTRCAGNCVNCPNSHRTLLPDGMILQRDRLTRREPTHTGMYEALRAIEPYPEIECVAPFLMEGPFLNKNLIPCLNKLKVLGKKVLLYSTLTHADTHTLRAIAEDGLVDELHISYHGYDQASWMKWHGNTRSQHANMQANLAYLSTLIKDGGYEKPRLILNTVNTPENMWQLNHIRGKFHSLVDEIWPVAYDDFHGTFPDLTPGPRPEKRFPCQRLWTSLNILVDGNVTPCCIDYDEQMVIGNITKSSLEEIYHGTAAEKWRDQHSQGIFTGPCETCQAWNRYSNQAWRDHCEKEGWLF